MPELLSVFILIQCFTSYTFTTFLTTCFCPGQCSPVKRRFTLIGKSLLLRSTLICKSHLIAMKWLVIEIKVTFMPPTSAKDDGVEVGHIGLGEVPVAVGVGVTICAYYNSITI